MKRESRDALITWRGFGNTNKKRIQKVKVYLSNVITWRGFGNTNKKRIQKVKEIVETDKWKEKGKKEEDKPSFLSKVVRKFSWLANFPFSLFIIKNASHIEFVLWITFLFLQREIYDARCYILGVTLMLISPL